MITGGCCGISFIRHDRILSSLVDEIESVSCRALWVKPQSRKTLLRINQETGPEIVLFRQGFARFDRANTADDLTVRRIRIHTFSPKREQIRDGTPAMQYVLCD
jgi:hypothetical protein